MTSPPPTLTRRDCLALGAGVPLIASACGPTVSWEPDAIPEDRTAFPRTVLAGDATADEAVLAMHLAVGDTARLRVWREGRPGRLVLDDVVTFDPQGFAKIRLRELSADTVYRYVWLVGEDPEFTGRSLIGRMRTAPTRGRAPVVTMCLGSCIGSGSVLPDFVDPDTNAPFTWPLLENTTDVPFDVFVHVGDQGYLDEVWAAGGSYEQYLAAWGAYHGGSYRSVFPRGVLYTTWDDHEVTDNRTVDPFPTDPADIARMANAKEAWWRVMPIRGQGPTTDTVWRSFVWGDTVEFILLDCRYENDGEQLVSDAQLDWFLDRLTASTARFVCVCTDKPFADIMLETAPYPGAGERWQGFRDQRDAVTDLIDDLRLSNVLFVTGDVHMNYVGTLSASGDRLSDGLHEVCCTSGNLNPLTEFLSTEQMSYTALDPRLPQFTFDPGAGTVTVRFHDADGALDHEAVLALPPRG